MMIVFVVFGLILLILAKQFKKQSNTSIPSLLKAPKVLNYALGFAVYKGDSASVNELIACGAL